MKLAIGLTALCTLLLAQSATACELVKQATIKEVLGPDIVDTTVDPASFCLFISSTTAAQFSVRTDTRVVYQQISIPKPFTSTEVGERGRYHKYPKGGVAVQFVQGDVSVTLAVRLITNDGRDYLPMLLDIARAVAAKLS